MDMCGTQEGRDDTGVSGWLNWQSIGLKIQWIPLVTRVPTPSGAQEKLVSFSESKCCDDSLLVCPTVYVRAHKNDHVRGTLKTLWSTSEFGGLRKHEKTQHAHVGLGSADLAAAVALPRQGGPNVPQGIKIK